MLTKERLREVLTYIPDSGLFINNERRGCVPNGCVLGCLDKSTGYIRIMIDGKRYRAHRLAWLFMIGEIPHHQVDHINRDRTDNRWANLREATNSSNQLNAVLHKDNISGTPGITWNKQCKKWMVHYKCQYVGLYPSIKEAKKARMEAEESDGYGGFRFNG